MLALFILCLLIGIHGESYLTYKQLNDKLESYVNRFNEKNGQYMKSKSIKIGMSTFNKDMYAYCYGNCEFGNSSVHDFLR